MYTDLKTLFRYNIGINIHVEFPLSVGNMVSLLILYRLPVNEFYLATLLCAE